jgi:hypothetical protein
MTLVGLGVQPKTLRYHSRLAGFENWAGAQDRLNSSNQACWVLRLSLIGQDTRCLKKLGKTTKITISKTLVSMIIISTCQN